MNNQKQYKTALVRIIKSELFGSDGVVRSTRLEKGLALAYAGDLYGGVLTLSRKGDVMPGDREVEIVKRDFGVAVPAFDMKVLNVSEVSRGVEGGHSIIRLRVLFGEQKSLF